ncbi:MAG: protein-export chaperone SecB [Pseudomonadota bacterium]
MSESSEQPPENSRENPRQAVQVQMRVERMYLKDASLESPGAPSIFGEQFRPEMQVDINTTVNSLGDNRHEVVLSATVTATRDEQRTAYLVEVHQAGIFVIEGVTGNPLRQVLGIACPNMLFPYIREAIDNLVVKAGFPALQLAPVNFEALYTQAVQQQQQQQQQAAGSQDQQVKH